jgi:hypothetical protein
MPNPAAFTVKTKEHLGHGKTDQFTVRQLWSATTAGTGRHYMVVDEDVECGQEGVSVFTHTLIMDTLLPCPNLGGPLHMIFTESII